MLSSCKEEISLQSHPIKLTCILNIKVGNIELKGEGAGTRIGKNVGGFDESGIGFKLLLICIGGIEIGGIKLGGNGLVGIGLGEGGF
jgi:hypothetical protein